MIDIHELKLVIMGSSLGCKPAGQIGITDRRSVLELSEGEAPSIESVARLIKAGKFTKIVCLCGAGISVSAGKFG